MSGTFAKTLSCILLCSTFTSVNVLEAKHHSKHWSSYKWRYKHKHYGLRPLLKIFPVQNCNISDRATRSIESAELEIIRVELRKVGARGKKSWIVKDLSRDPIIIDVAQLGCALWDNYHKFAPPEGTYDLMRLVFDRNATVVEVSGKEYPINFFGKRSLDFEFTPHLTVEDDKTSVCVVNFDKAASLKSSGSNRNKCYHFNPKYTISCSDPISNDDDDDGSSSTSSSSVSSSSSSEQSSSQSSNSSSEESSSSSVASSSSSEQSSSVSSEVSSSSSSSEQSSSVSSVSSSVESSASSQESSSSVSSSSSSSSQCIIEGDVDPGYECLSTFILPVTQDPATIILPQ